MSSRSELRRIAIQNPDKLLEIALKQEDRIAHLEAVVQDYEQALEFYANCSWLTTIISHTVANPSENGFIHEKGQKAREVLEKWRGK